MSYNFDVKYYVYGRNKYSEILPNPATALGYFSDSVIQVIDTGYPAGEFRMLTKDLTVAQQAAQTGRDFAVVNVAIDFTQK